MASFNLKGMGVALVTPFKEDKNIDLDALDRLLDSLVEAKVDYIVAFRSL